MTTKRGRPENLKPWKPGESGNPEGRPAIPEEIKKLRLLTNEEIKEVATLLLDKNYSAIQLMENDPSTPMLKLWMVKVALKATDRGDMMTLNAFLDRVVGKVKEQVEHSGKITLADLVAGDEKE
jgi:hypothetical protein